MHLPSNQVPRQSGCALLQLHVLLLHTAYYRSQNTSLDCSHVNILRCHCVMDSASPQALLAAVSAAMPLWAYSAAVLPLIAAGLTPAAPQQGALTWPLLQSPAAFVAQLRCCGFPAVWLRLNADFTLPPYRVSQHQQLLLYV